MLDRIEKFNQCAVISFFFQQPAGKAQFENAFAQAIGSLRTLPEEARQAGLDFKRRDRRNPCGLAHQKRALAEEKTLEQLRRIEAHPARPLL